MPLTVLDGLSIVPFGCVSCADTISSGRSVSSIAKFNSTVQITVTVDVASTGLDGVLVTDTEAMEGTTGGRKAEDCHFMALLALTC